MNPTPADNNPDLRYAEYVLGVLDATARAQVEREIATNAAVAAKVATWQERLQPLVEELEPQSPPDYVWHRIRQELGLPAPSVHEPRARRKPGLWSSLRFWRWLTLGAGTVAAACIVLLLALAPMWKPASLDYMSTVLTQTNGEAGWTVAMDRHHARIAVLPARPPAVARFRVLELWLIPQAGRPIGIGIVAPYMPTALTVDAKLARKLAPNAVLAVSVEPPGGSPTGRPTGPVIAEGMIGPSLGAAVVGQPDDLVSHAGFLCRSRSPMF